MAERKFDGVRWEALGRFSFLLSGAEDEQPVGGCPTFHSRWNPEVLRFKSADQWHRTGRANLAREKPGFHVGSISFVQAMAGAHGVDLGRLLKRRKVFVASGIDRPQSQHSRVGRFFAAPPGALRRDALYLHGACAFFWPDSMERKLPTDGAHPPRNGTSAGVCVAVTELANVVKPHRAHLSFLPSARETLAPTGLRPPAQGCPRRAGYPG